MLSMFMSAIEATIVATSMPTIVASLGGVALYSWVFSAYLLLQAVSVPIYGKLADLFGRKPVYLFGVTVFLAGSLLAGLAGSMQALVFYRLVQGLGAGAVMPLAMTLIGDLYSLEERGQVQGYLASVWGTASIVGPLSGALIVQYADWAWVFWVNIPFGMVAFVLITIYLHEDGARRQARIDLPGAGLLLAGLSALMLLLTEATHWSLTVVGGLALLVALCFALLVRREGRVAEPMLNLALWRNPLIANANLATLAAGIAMVGLVSFLPTYVQGALGTSALVAGFTLSAMSIGWPIAATVTGRVLVRMGPRRMARLGGCTVSTGALLVALLAPHGPPAIAVGAFVIGFGFGILNTTFIVSIQTSVAWAQRGAATASNMLMRLLGNAIGVALFGGVFNAVMQHRLVSGGLAGRFSMDSVQGLLDRSSSAGQALLAEGGAALRLALAGSLEAVFWGVLVAALAAMALALRLPQVTLRDQPARPVRAAD